LPFVVVDEGIARVVGVDQRWSVRTHFKVRSGGPHERGRDEGGDFLAAKQSSASSNFQPDRQQSFGSIVVRLRGTLERGAQMQLVRKKHKLFDWRLTMDQIGRELRKEFQPPAHLPPQLRTRIRELKRRSGPHVQNQRLNRK
jgi:hypothetical protein